jgi:glucose-1-phosphate adenylyltransferase
MLTYHKQKGADATIAVIEVKWEEASRFGIMSTSPDHHITEFAEKPKQPKSNLASMGVYMFSWPVLKRYLIEDDAKHGSTNDFGKDLIPAMLNAGQEMFAYPFEGYWKDVGTVESLWEASMDLLESKPRLNLNDRSWRIYSVNPNQPPHYIGPAAKVQASLINEGCVVFGDVDHSVLFYGVHVDAGSRIKDSVIMPNVQIGRDVIIHKAIIGEGCVIEDGSVIGSEGDDEITLIGSFETVSGKRGAEV